MSTRRERKLFSQGDTIGIFTIVKLLGQGGYGDIYSVKRPDSDELFAMKTESFTADKRGLSLELTFFEELQDSDLFPRMIESGHTPTHRYLVMEMLGPSLSNTRRQMEQHKYSLSTTLRLGIYMLQCIRDFHKHGLLHRDIKPGNFLLRKGGKNPVVLIDFGLSKRYIDTKTGEPFPEREKAGFRGTAKYASINAHRYKDQGPRDDIMSWLYSLVELVDGRLPWGNERDGARVLRKKTGISDRTLLRNLPSEVLDIWKYVDELKYASKVNYDHIIGLMTKAMARLGVKASDPFDWEALPPSKVAAYSPIPELPRSRDYLNDFPVIEVVDDCDEEAEQSRCEACSVQ